MKFKIDQQLKKEVYIGLSMFLGVLLGLLIHVGVEWSYLSYAQAHSLAINWNSYLGSLCSLPLFLQLSFLITGALGGLFFGKSLVAASLCGEASLAFY